MTGRQYKPNSGENWFISESFAYNITNARGTGQVPSVSQEGFLTSGRIIEDYNKYEEDTTDGTSQKFTISPKQVTEWASTS